MGPIFRLSLQNGSLIWKVDVGPNLTTSAQVSCTQDGKVFAGYGGYSGNDANDRHIGGLYALDIKTGDTLWTRSFPYRVYTPVAVGEIQGHKGTAVIVAMGTPGQYPKKRQRIILCGLWTPTPEPKTLIAVCFNFHPFWACHGPKWNATVPQSFDFESLFLIRRKFRGQTSDNMDRWRSRGEKSQRRAEERRSEKRKGQRKDAGARKGRKAVFFHWVVAPWVDK